jgi:hypothetical protein
MTMHQTLPAIATLAIAVGLQSPGAASPSAPIELSGQPAGQHRVIAMYANSGDLHSQTIPAQTFTTIDQATIQCPATTCTLALSAMQSIKSADSQGEWAIVGVVDGQNLLYSYQGFEPIASYLTGNWQGNYTVSEGTHIVTFQIYADVSVLFNVWSDSVNIITH